MDNSGIFVTEMQILSDMNEEKLNIMYGRIMERFDTVEQYLDRMIRQKDCLDGDKLLDNHDMCAILGIIKRTLARYCQKKLVSYYMIDGRTYYKSSEIKDFLKRKGKELDRKLGTSFDDNENW